MAKASFYDAVYALFLATKPSEALTRRALLLAGVMRNFAKMRGRPADAEVWAAAGLLYHPDEATANEIKRDALKRAGADEAFLEMVTCDEVEDDATEATALLVALDPLTRLIGALAETRRPATVRGLKVSAVQKRFSDRHFLPAVNRANIRAAVKHLHLELGSFTSQTLKAMLLYEEDIARAQAETRLMARKKSA